MRSTVPGFQHLSLRLGVLLAALGIASVASAQLSDNAQTLFNEHCVVCHGAFAEGGSAPDLTNPQWQAQRTDEELASAIERGIPETAMPGFAAKIDAAARNSLVALIRGFAKKAIQPTTAEQTPAVSVDPQRLVNAADEPQNWLMYGLDYGQTRYSSLDDVDRSNAENLVPVWSFQTGTPDGLTGMSLVVDGVIFLTTSWNHVFAIDARTGAELWHYQRRLPEADGLSYCCGPANRGVAIYKDLLYMTTLDAHLVALEARTGRVRWDVELGKPEDRRCRAVDARLIRCRTRSHLLERRTALPGLRRRRAQGRQSLLQFRRCA